MARWTDLYPKISADVRFSNMLGQSGMFMILLLSLVPRVVVMA